LYGYIEIVCLDKFPYRFVFIDALVGVLEVILIIAHQHETKDRWINYCLQKLAVNVTKGSVGWQVKYQALALKTKDTLTGDALRDNVAVLAVGNTPRHRTVAQSADGIAARHE